MAIATLGIDLAKSVFELCGMETTGKVVLRKKLSRSKCAPFIAQLSRCVIGMEAGGGSHHWVRKFAAYGHEVRLISPQFVKPFVKANKTDRADAEAICEAVQRPTMRFVPVKNVEQQDLQALHRVWERLVKHRTALSNEMRGLLAEYGIVLPKTIPVLKQYLRTQLEEADGELTDQGLELLRGLQQELAHLEAHIERVETKIQAVCQAHPVCHRLLSIPGIGPLSATAIVAAIGAAKQFKNGREFAAYLGLVPRQHSSGGKVQLLGISKRGDPYLRKLLIHDARTVLQWAHKYTALREGTCDLRQLGEQADKGNFRESVEPEVLAIMSYLTPQGHSRRKRTRLAGSRPVLRPARGEPRPKTHQLSGWCQVQHNSLVKRATSESRQAHRSLLSSGISPCPSKR